MSRNEAQTRFDLIDPALFARGWNREDIRIEVMAAQVDIVDVQGQRRPIQSGAEPIPLAIAARVEAEFTAAQSLRATLTAQLAEVSHLPAALLPEAFSTPNS